MLLFDFTASFPCSQGNDSYACYYLIEYMEEILCCYVILFDVLVSWTKHGCTSLLIPGHDPPLNITIFGDIAINPGPETSIQNNLKRRNENLPNILDLHINTRVVTYTRAELLGIRRASRSFVCGSVLHVLKLNGLLRFRGCSMFSVNSNYARI